jgi:hypothetical protein
MRIHALKKMRAMNTKTGRTRREKNIKVACQFTCTQQAIKHRSLRSLRTVGQIAFEHAEDCRRLAAGEVLKENRAEYILSLLGQAFAVDTTVS